MAIICLSFAQYAVEAFVSECDPPVTVIKLVAMLAIGNNPQRSHITKKNLALKHSFSFRSNDSMRKLLQCKFGHGRTEHLCVGQNDCGAYCY